MPSDSAAFHLRCILALACACLFTPIIQAQSTTADLNSRLMNKPLYLRGCWRGNTLRFDSTGNLIGTSQPVTFTLCGFDLSKIQTQKDKLILDGQRIGLEFVNDNPKRVALHRMRIEIAPNTSGDFGPALNEIFVDGLANMVPLMPSYWQAYAQKTFLSEQVTSSTMPTTHQPAKSLKIGSGVTPPKLIHSAEPITPDSARQLGYGGTTLISLWVQPDGKVTNLSILHAAGLGLDECALAAVQQYVFAPALQNGKPIPVQINIGVNFGTL